jgi:stage II sporulation protein D
LTVTAAAIALPRTARAQSDADPAVTASSPSLRVLLGPGDVVPGSQPGSFSFNGRPYRGEFRRTGDGSIVNFVDIEQYLYAVVPREMSPSWPAAALQAQAICARTYVLQRSNPKRDYDLVPSELDQVYAGVQGESPAGRAAVDATATQVLRYGKQYATVAYSSCCGGHTEASADAWGSTAVPYLGGVTCTYCVASPNYRWNARLPLADLENRFTDLLAPFGALRDVRIEQTDSSGRARSLELVAERGTVDVKGSAFRLAAGPRVVRSLLITRLQLDSGAGTLVAEGGGLGHGVGMCQWGARGMALAGRSARDVLALYFPGTQVSIND